MEESDIIWIATKAVSKGYNYEQVYYGDDLYGNEKYADEVWEYVTECKEIGITNFYEKYKEFKLY